MQVSEESARQPASLMIQDGLEFPPLPEVSRQLSVYSNLPDNQVDIDKLSQLIVSDPALTARLVQIGTSPLADPAFRDSITTKMHSSYLKRVGFLTGVSIKGESAKTPESILADTRDSSPTEICCITPDRLFQNLLS